MGAHNSCLCMAFRKCGYRGHKWLPGVVSNLNEKLWILEDLCNSYLIPFKMTNIKITVLSHEALLKCQFLKTKFDI